MLPRNINYKTTLAIVIGGVIGSGIFMKPSLMMAQLGSPILLLSIWIIAGFITLLGALTNAEAAILFPETGGQYVFFQKMYGDGFAFVYGWAAFAVFNTAGNASIAYVFSQYANYFIALPKFSIATEHLFKLNIPFVGHFYLLENIGVKALTILLILLLSLLNYFSVKQSGVLQRVVTSLKIIAIGLLLIGIFFSGKGSFTHLHQTLAVTDNSWLMAVNAMAAIAGAFWAYDGWNNITFIAGEIKNPQKNIPKSLFVGLSLCIAVYVLVNLAYIYILPTTAIANSSFIAADTATAAWGKTGGAIIALMVMLSTIGTSNANILATARVTFAMGNESKLFTKAVIVHKKYQTPGNAILLNAALSILFVLSGSFDTLTDMLIFVSWFFYGMSSLGVIVLRYKYKNLPRPYKVPLYPIVPAIFVLFTIAYLVLTVYNDVLQFNEGKAPIINSVFGILITCVGLPVYWLSKREG
jgi:basic amino acid/polyamine antiporter, APA family